MARPLWQLNPQLSPLVRGPYGLGDGSIGDFNSLANSVPNFNQSWQQVATQLQQEGAGPADFAGAQIAYTTAFEQQISQSLGVSADDAIASAKQYVMAGQTIAGAVSTVGGLINSMKGMSGGQALTTFTGTMIGALELAGAVSAGVGAAIVGAVGIVASIIDALSGKPSGVQVCQNVSCSSNPNWVVNCCCVWGTAAAPGSPNWRSFPDPNSPDDAAWYNTNGVQWKNLNILGPNAQGGGQWSQSTYSLSTMNRLIYNMFPGLRTLECEQKAGIPGAPGNFQAAFFAAWKANAEYAINGLKPAADWQVLLHTARFWNRAHQDDGTGGYIFHPADKLTLTTDLFGFDTQDYPGCPSTFTNYENVLVKDLLNNVQATDPLLYSGGLRINTGPIKGQGFVTPPGKASTPTSATSKTAAVATSAVAAGVVATVAYSYLTGKAVDTVAKGLWLKLAGLVK